MVNEHIGEIRPRQKIKNHATTSYNMYDMSALS